jgi:NAD(P)-dependent dehydrogenase (short-subunit alcohol dehydrogenase family)
VKDLSGKVALVTGAASGIGLGIARACADNGMKVALCDIDEPVLEQSAAALAEAGADVLALTLDVTDREGWARAAEEVPAAMGPVQLLVNNAGVSTAGMRFDEIRPELWDRVISINLTSVYNGVDVFLGGMRSAGGGHIVNTASMAGLVGYPGLALAGYPGLAPYCTTKAGVIALSEALRHELAEAGIGVSVLCPGSVRSRLWRTSRVVRGLPDVDTPPPGLRSGSIDPNGLDPYDVGCRVVAAVLADELYVITHPELRESVARHYEDVLGAFDRAPRFAVKPRDPA